LCFVAYSVPPEGKGKKESFEPVKVYDASVNPQYIGILVHLEPVGTDPYDAPGGITTFIPTVNKFPEFEWNGEYASPRTAIVELYFVESDCSGTPYTDGYLVMDNLHYLYEFRELQSGTQVHSFYTMGTPAGIVRSDIQGRIVRGSDCEPFTYTSANDVFYPLTTVDTGLSFPFQTPFTFE
jgi:hypothetical protein